MEAIQFTASDKNLEFLLLDIPKISGPKDVLIKVAYSGVCGTDIHIIQGEFPTSDKLILGHEFSGTVVEIGNNVRNLSRGDRVVVDPNNFCSSCSFCHSGNVHFCTRPNNNTGVNRNGGWAQYVLVQEDATFKIPNTVNLEQGALIEPMSCVSHGWDLISPVPVGINILITGAGIIGTLWACTLHLQGHRRVTVSEPNITRLKLLKKLDLGFSLVTPEQLQQNHEHDPENYVFDLVIDCSGYPPAVEKAVSMLQHGGTLCLFGVAPPHAEMRLKPFDLFYKELKIVGVRINPFSFPKAIGLVEAMGTRYLDFGNLGVKTYALKEYRTAIEDLKKSIYSKAIFVL